jgi:hypothetical protein
MGSGIYRAIEGRGRQMKGHGEKLTRKQEALMSALLLTPTLADAAHTASIGEVTAWRWLKDPTVQEAYREARRAAVQHAITQVQRATGKAVETLRNVMQDADTPASARVSAAKVILEIGPPVANGQFVAVRDRSFRVRLCQGPTTQSLIDLGYQKGFPF